MTRYLLTGTCLVILVWGVYCQTRQFEFVEFDDPQLVSENVFVRQGLTLAGVRWAFFSAWRENVFFYPLSLVSHMVDVTGFGLNAGRHHLTSVALHAAVAISLFTLLVQLTGAFWRPALAAAFFAVHPLGVDSVAWVAERSNLLCGLLVVNSLSAFVRYRNIHETKWYVLSIALFLLALLAKPTAVMLPVILWLVRLPGCKVSGKSQPEPSGFRNVLELIPFFILSGLRLMAVLAAEQGASPIVSANVVTVTTLAANALVSVTAYLVDLFYPFRLSVYYPFPAHIPLWQPLLSGLLLLIVSIAAFIYRRRRPMSWAGWLWFLIFLMPSLGVIRSGPWPARADHYVYISLMGLMTALVWMLPAQRIAGSPKRRIEAGVSAAILLIYFATSAFIHAGHYRDSVTLFSRVLALDENNFLACIELGNAYRKQGRMDLAEIFFRKAIAIKPDSAGAHNNLGLVLAAEEDWTGAERHFKTALALSPRFSMAHNNLINLYLKQGRPPGIPADRGGIADDIPEKKQIK